MSKFHWHTIRKDTQLYVKTCHTCNITKKASRNPRHPLTELTAGFPFERVHIDFCGPFPKTARSNKYVLVLTDAYTKWVMAKPTADETAKSTVDTQLGWFLLFGLPHILVSDQGKAFESNLLAAVCEQFEISKLHTSPYRPQCNGQVERFNRTMNAALRAYCQDNPRDWDLHVPFITSAIRSTISTATGFTPNKLFLGREVTSPADIEFSLPPNAKLTQEEYVVQLRKDLQKAHDTARKNLKERCVKNKKNYDIRILQRQYDAGDAVYVLNRTPVTGIPKKLKAVYKGPALVVKRISSYTYKIRYREKVFFTNHDDLKPCEGRIPKWLERAKHPDRINDPQRDRANGPFCTCRKGDDGDFMIACDWCNEWYHGTCVGIPSTRQIDSYKCDACAEDREEFKMTALELRERKKKAQGNAQQSEQQDSDSSSDSESD